MIDAIGPDLALVPLVGHTRGHSGVAVRGEHGWLLHAGDAYFHRGQIDPSQPPMPVGMKIFQRAVDTNTKVRKENQARLAELHRRKGHEVTVFCAHDAESLAKLQARG